MNALVTLKGVTKRYGSVTALDNVSLEIPQGDFYTIMGPNGSGKTTLMKIVACLDRQTCGEVFFGGEKVADKNSGRIRKRVTMVFQKTVLFDASVYDNVAYGLRLRNESERDIAEKVKIVLRLVKLEGYDKRWARSLSGGEQQRVALARALILDTELLLLDEPTANLDPLTTSIIEEAIVKVNREHGTTILMATHNMFQIQRMTGKAALLIGGRLVREGTVQELFAKPSELLAGFARLENVFSGFSSIAADGGSTIDVGDGVRLEATFSKAGEATVYVRPEDIFVSKQPLSSSARNVFKGRVVEAADLGAVVKLRVDAGKVFAVQVTKRSFNDLNLGLSSEVYLAFKASSIYMV